MTPGTRTEPIIMENEGHQRTEYGVRWHWENGSISYALSSTSRSHIESFLADPPAGVMHGELMRRTITTTSWEPVAAPVQQALVGQPERDYNLPGFPAELVKATSNHNGLLYTYIGEDGDTLVILGHPTRNMLDALPTWLGFDPNYEPETTYGRLLFACPKHKPDAAVEGCQFCDEIEPGAWWLDWSTGENAKSNAGEPGYFPIVVWEVDA